MRDAHVVSDYLEPERMRKAIVRSIDRLSNPMLLLGCRACVELPVFSEPAVDLHHGNRFTRTLKPGLIALAKMSVAAVGVSIATMHWGNVVKAMMRDAAHWIQQDAMLEKPVLCLDALQTTWADLVDRRGGERRVSAQDMQQLVQSLPVGSLAKGDWWTRWMIVGQWDEVAQSRMRLILKIGDQKDMAGSISTGPPSH